MNKLLIAILTGSLLLTGCSHRPMSEAEMAAIPHASDKQAMVNAQAQYPVQKAQSVKKVKMWEGMRLDIDSTGLIVDGKHAAVIEKEEKATVYQQGLFNFIVYSNGKIAVTDLNNVFKGYAK